MFSLYISYILYLIAAVFCHVSHYAEKQFIDATRSASVLRSSVETYLNQWRSCLFSTQLIYDLFTYLIQKHITR